MDFHFDNPNEFKAPSKQSPLYFFQLRIVVAWRAYTQLENMLNQFLFAFAFARALLSAFRYSVICTSNPMLK